MKHLMLATFSILCLAGCDSAVRPAKDAGPDAPDHIDVVDLVDVTDVTDVPDVVDVPEDTGYPDGWPAPSCDEDPHQIAVATTGSNNYKAFYPNLFIPQADYAIDRTEVITFNVETQESRVLFSLDGEYLTDMVIDAESQTIWLSAQERWNYQNPSDRAPPRILRWDLVTETLEDLTPQLPQLRTEDCEANQANLFLQMLDLERNRLLLFCDYAVSPRVLGSLYFLDLSTGAIEYLGRYEERFYMKGNPVWEQFNRSYFNTYCSEWTDWTYEGDWDGCYWRLDGPTPQLVYHSSDGDRVNGATSMASSENRVYQTWMTDSGIAVTGTDLETLQVEYLPQLPVFPQSLSPTGRNFPRILSWAEGYFPNGGGSNWLQATEIGHVFLWDIDANVYRQVTCKTGNGRYAGIQFIPGEPTGRYGLINSVIGDTKIIHLKDLRAAGIMSEDGHLLPPPEK